MNEMQSKLLDMMKWFHGYCEENGLRYYALGGTALGAVRHGGFIPWDDDLDVGMPRADYDRMISLCENGTGNTRYRIEAPGQNRDFIYPFCKAYDTETTLVENARIKTKRGVYIDIFPLDGIGNTKEESEKNYRRINRDISLLNTKICALRRGGRPFRNFFIIVGRMIPDFLVSRDGLIRKINRKAAAKPYDEYPYVANLFGEWKANEIAERECFGTPTLCKFEDTEIYIPEQSDRYLTSLYGDWRKLPPEDKRVTHHDYVALDLNRSYLED